MNDLIKQMQADAETIPEDNMGKIGAVATDIAETENEIANLKEQLKRDIYPTTKPYIWFDAYDDKKNIYEFKYRHTDYETFVIEFRKWSNNYVFAHINNLKFIYVVVTGKNTYLFDISKLNKEKHNYSWQWNSMKSTTEFKNNNYIDKGYHCTGDRNPCWHCNVYDGVLEK